MLRTQTIISLSVHETPKQSRSSAFKTRQQRNEQGDEWHSAVPARFQMSNPWSHNVPQPESHTRHKKVAIFASRLPSPLFYITDH